MNIDRLPEIEKNLRAPALNLRKAALDELAEVPSEIAVPILQKLANESNFTLRRLAVMGLGNHPIAASFQALQTIIKTDEDANVIAEAANSIFEFGEPAIPVLQQLFENSDNWLVRQTVISLLVEIDRPEILLAVALEAIKDETQTVREAGILALRQVLTSPLQDEAFNILKVMSEDAYWRNRWQAAIALRSIQHPQAQELLSKLQRDEHFRVVAAALDGTWD
ncbi:MAG: HEAT repeat domain-containing protein [Richelia sp. CSU_2_1]|nr:HEAT repeat domain-containing protein [Microcoleus sp. SU_5_6]NJL68387.1 HEAT repeat domain-containing protein [Microcoleus sp. SM1_3_4]NJR22212.1 HEAT repeat domain-containing protein [Richelia sp. CSU_2_1]